MEAFVFSIPRANTEIKRKEQTKSEKGSKDEQAIKNENKVR